MTNPLGGKKPAYRPIPELGPLGDEYSLDVLDQLDDFADPDFEEIVGTANRVAAGESFD